MPGTFLYTTQCSWPSCDEDDDACVVGCADVAVGCAAIAVGCAASGTLGRVTPNTTVGVLATVLLPKRNCERELVSSSLGNRPPHVTDFQPMWQHQHQSE